MQNPVAALCYKNFGAIKGISHIGLGVSALNNAKSMRAKGHTALIWPVTDFKGFAANLKANPQVTHVNISAPWFPTLDIAMLAYEHPEVKFTIASHSNVGFLQADTRGVQLIREELDLEQNSFNFRTAGNSQRYCDWIAATYDRPSMLLPNMYYLDTTAVRPVALWQSGELRIGAFGAIRQLKNLMTAGAAALSIARATGATLVFSISGNRNEGAGVVVASLREMFRDLPYARLTELPWQQWSDFRRTVANQHLLLQPSYTETFNIVTADGVAEGVPSVVSEAIDWAPDHWKADIDDALSIARTGRQLLTDSHAASDGLKALQAHNATALACWEAWLKS